VSEIAHPDDDARSGSASTNEAVGAAAAASAPPVDDGRERTLPPDLAAARQRRLAQHLALVTAAHAIGVWEIDIDTGAMQWNTQMLSLYGVESSGTPRHPAAWLERHILPEDRERVLRAARPAQPVTGENWPGANTRRIEHRIVRGDGRVRWIESQSALVEDEDGRRLMLGTSRGITERKESEQQLRDALQRLQWATDWARVGVFVRDPATAGGYWNPQMFDLFGLAPDPLQPTTPPPFERVVERVHPDDQARYQAYWRAIRDLREVALPDRPLRVLLPDGAVRWLTVRAQRIDGRIDAPVAGVAIDITDRMQSEQRAEENARRLQVASEAGRIGLSERNLLTGAGFWNATLLEFNGLPPDAPTPSRDDLLRACHPDDRPVLEQAWRELSEGSGVAEYEARTILPDGTVRWLRSRARVERDASGKPVRVVGAAVDVTEARAAAQRLSDALQRLTLAAEAGNIGIWERDLRDGSGAWDATLFKLMDFPPPVVPSREQTLARVHPDDRERAQA
jgi:PAS domain S-box-containing protein